MFDVFDSMFKGDEVSASVSRKCDDGKTRTVKLNVAPKGDEPDAFEQSAKIGGVKLSKKWKEDGPTWSKTVPLSGAKAASALHNLRDSAQIPASVAARNRAVPVENGAAS